MSWWRPPRLHPAWLRAVWMRLASLRRYASAPRLTNANLLHPRAELPFPLYLLLLSCSPCIPLTLPPVDRQTHLQIAI